MISIILLLEMLKCAVDHSKTSLAFHEMTGSLPTFILLINCNCFIVTVKSLLKFSEEKTLK